MVGEQYWLASAAQYLGVEQRFAKTVRLGTKMDGGGRPDAWATVKRYNKTYCARNVHVVRAERVVWGGPQGDLCRVPTIRHMTCAFSWGAFVPCNT